MHAQPSNQTGHQCGHFAVQTTVGSTPYYIILKDGIPVWSTKPTKWCVRYYSAATNYFTMEDIETGRFLRVASPNFSQVIAVTKSVATPSDVALRWNWKSGKYEKPYYIQSWPHNSLHVTGPIVNGKVGPVKEGANVFVIVTEADFALSFTLV